MRAGDTAPDAASVLHALQALGDEEAARFARRFFRTGPGEYGEGDVFLGIRVPELRRLARTFRALPLDGVRELLASEYHEARFVALVLLVERYGRGDSALRASIFDLYLASTGRINNWDLVDVSAPGIVGAHLLHGDAGVLDRLARSSLLWERRIAMVATQAFIRAGRLEDTLRIAGILLADPHDLIHKATGWMLRELGKRDPGRLEDFLARHHARMPRTMLRYAIERLPPARRSAYLLGQVSAPGHGAAGGGGVGRG